MAERHDIWISIHLDKIVEWILEAWNDLSKDIMSSFKSCGLNIAVDGSEDHLIDCLKKNETCSAGTERS